jgi:hypothetical protein
MMQTIQQTLKALDNVGKEAVSIQLNLALFPQDVIAAHAACYAPTLRLAPGGTLHVEPGPQAYKALRSLLGDLVAGEGNQA